ncbi:MAG: chromosomal replication initiator protein DnaA [Rhodospirillaceae bacterium]
MDRADAARKAAAALEQEWKQVRTRLRIEVGESAYRNWIRPLILSNLSGAEVTLFAPTRFMRDWVLSHYADRIRTIWASQNSVVQSVDIVAQRLPPAAQLSLETLEDDLPDDTEKVILTVSKPVAVQAEYRAPEPSRIQDDNGIDEVSATLDPRFTFDNFVVGKPNELAHAASRRVAEAGAVAFNPLFLYGGVGLGKTHLMHAIAWDIRTRQPERRVIYLSAEKFMYQFIRALRFKDTMSFKQLFRSVDVLMIDDVQFISGKDSTQEEFFHTFNALVDQNRQVIISADKSPSDLEGMEERLRSRLGWGLVADLHPTNYELRLGILQSKAYNMKAVVPVKVLEFLAHKIISNVRELEGALNRIVAHAELVGRAITIETTQEVLHDLLRANDRRVTIDEIQKKVAEHYNIRLADMHSIRRARLVVRPRQVAMYLCKHLTSRSLPEIGRKFGGRDHTTVMHAVRKIEELRGTDASFDEDVELLRRMLES